MKETSLDIFCREARKTSGKKGGKPVYTKDEEDILVAKAQAGDIEARNNLLEANLMFGVQFAKQWEHTGLDIDDLVQAAMIGMVNAVNRHDSSRGRLTSTALWYMRNSIGEAVGGQVYEVVLARDTAGDLRRIRAGG